MILVSLSSPSRGLWGSIIAAPLEELGPDVRARELLKGKARGGKTSAAVSSTVSTISQSSSSSASRGNAPGMCSGSSAGSSDATPSRSLGNCWSRDCDAKDGREPIWWRNPKPRSRQLGSIVSVKPGSLKYGCGMLPGRTLAIFPKQRATPRNGSLVNGGECRVEVVCR
jgi:hypothetical protein